jgi:hypothetical protein
MKLTDLNSLAEIETVINLITDDEIDWAIRRRPSLGSNDLTIGRIICPNTRRLWAAMMKLRTTAHRQTAEAAMAINLEEEARLQAESHRNSDRADVLQELFWSEVQDELELFGKGKPGYGLSLCADWTVTFSQMQGTILSSDEVLRRILGDRDAGEGPGE